MDEKALIPGAFYPISWDGPSGRESTVGQFVETRMEKWDYWNRRPTVESSPQNYWKLFGGVQPDGSTAVRQISTPGASNQWKIGPRIVLEACEMR